MNAPYIKINNPMPGIVGLLWMKIRSGKALSKLAQTILKGPSPLTVGERELIGAYVSCLNDCNFCCNSHSAVAEYFLGSEVVEKVKSDLATAPISEKMKALLKIAGQVQQGGKAVSRATILSAKAIGVTDDEIHDTVLIAAAFCMFNRYVDGLGTGEPENKKEYQEMGKRLAKGGYKFPNVLVRKMVIYIQGKKKRTWKV